MTAVVGDRFTLSSDERAELERWVEQHYKRRCSKYRSSQSPFGAIRGDRFRIAFRQTSINIDVDIICDCGEVFHSEKRMNKA